MDDSKQGASSSNPTGLTRAEILLLREAVNEAETWRGSLTDAEDRLAFDKRIEKMRTAMDKLKAASGYKF